MAFILDGTTIRRPLEIQENNDTQVSVKRTLSGNINRDYFGSNKRTWTLKYENVQPSDYTVIKNIYDSYLSTNVCKSWEITETNYTISSVLVHVDLQSREFNVRGSDYISDFTLRLVEA